MVYQNKLLWHINKTTKSYPSKCYIEFKDYDWTVLQKWYISYWSTPIYRWTTPARDTDQSTHIWYNFTWWSPTISTVTTDVTYVAQYTEVQTALVTFLQDDQQTILKQYYVKIWDTPSCSEPSKTSECYYYNFTWWDHSITVISSTDPVTYIAQYYQGPKSSRWRAMIPYDVNELTSWWCMQNDRWWSSIESNNWYSCWQVLDIQIMYQDNPQLQQSIENIEQNWLLDWNPISLIWFAQSTEKCVNILPFTFWSPFSWMKEDHQYDCMYYLYPVFWTWESQVVIFENYDWTILYQKNYRIWETPSYVWSEPERPYSWWWTQYYSFSWWSPTITPIQSISQNPIIYTAQYTLVTWIIFSYTWSDQTWTAPAWNYRIKCYWAWSNTSAWWFAQWDIRDVAAWTDFTIVVWQSWSSTSSTTYWFWWSSNYSNNRAWGWLSWIFKSTWTVTASDSSRALIIAWWAWWWCPSSNRNWWMWWWEVWQNWQWSNYWTAWWWGTQSWRNSWGNVWAAQFNWWNWSWTYWYGWWWWWFWGNSSIWDGSGDDDKWAWWWSWYVDSSNFTNIYFIQWWWSSAWQNGKVKIEFLS